MHCCVLCYALSVEELKCLAHQKYMCYESDKCMQMSNSNLDHLWRAFIHDTDTAAKTKDATQSDTFLNTTTCWLKMNIEDPTGNCSSTIEALQKAIGCNLVNTADLIVLAGDTEVSSEASANSVLGLGDDDEELCAENDADVAVDVAAASLELRQHLLRACNLPAPTMCAAYCAVCFEICCSSVSVMYRHNTEICQEAHVALRDSLRVCCLALSVQPISTMVRALESSIC